ncbi:MAG: Flp family type IVb pilin [Hyphomicrobiales bacterium]|nr:Flp family type IVb pilin [Hyphomicrobiales bacterium]
MFADERGATAIEYALLLGLICLVIITAIGATGDGLSASWNAVATKASDNLKTN